MSSKIGHFEGWRHSRSIAQTLKNNNIYDRGGTMHSTTEASASEIAEKYPGVIDVLRYHVATGRFGYVDRVMSAMSPDVVEEAVREAIRVALSAASSLRQVKASPCVFDKESGEWKVKEGKVITVTYSEEEEVRQPPPPYRARLHGRLYSIEGRLKILYWPPTFPAEDELAKFFDEIRSNLSVAKVVASLAMTLPAREEGE
ncbi:hypothetical protein [Infirmifilum sp.]|uniref:hypothetical protein n=1 Tax=Infirmifilum sp. TaxID=2856575 RepID=UPI003D0E6189